MRLFAPLIAVSLLAGSASRAGELYKTDFESFPVGDNLWAGTEGWLSNDLSSGAQGILGNVMPDFSLGKTAYLGFEPPLPSNQGFTTVYRPVNYDPALGGFPCVELDTLIGIQDSTLLNERRDSFFITFYNIDSDFLAAIEFNNQTGEVFRCDGVSAPIGTGLDFLQGDQEFGPLALQALFVRVDLVENTWSAFLAGIPLFIDVEFTASTHPRTIGDIAVEWLLSVTPQPGDNWILVADWEVRSAPKGVVPFEIESLERNGAGETTLRWLGEPGFDYHVWWSADLLTWQNGLPGSAFDGITQAGMLTFTDSDSLVSQRFYQVRRTASP